MNQQLFLEMIDAAINGKTIDLSEVDEEFIRVAKEQTFLPFLYVASKDKKYKKYYIQSVLIHERINEVGKLIDNILNEAKIPHIFLKGYELQNLYPDPNLRMMGDIDVLVKPEDYDKVLKLLLNNNFKTLLESEKDYELSYNNINVELHHKLFEDFRILKDFFNKPFENTISNESYNYKFNNNYNFIYIVGHYAKHINMGAGLREIIDIYLLLKNKKLDIDYIKNIFKKFKLDKFFNMILNELSLIFNYQNIEFKKNKSTSQMISYCLNCGIHGFANTNDKFSNEISVKYNGNKFAFILKRLFISLKELFVLYPWSKIIITIPFAYIYRFFYLLTHNQKKLQKAMNYKKDEIYKLLSSLNLINKNENF